MCPHLNHLCWCGANIEHEAVTKRMFNEHSVSFGELLMRQRIESLRLLRLDLVVRRKNRRIEDRHTNTEL